MYLQVGLSAAVDSTVSTSHRSLERNNTMMLFLVCLYPNGIMALIYERLGLYITMFVNFNMVVDFVVEILLDGYGLWFGLFLFAVDVGYFWFMLKAVQTFEFFGGMDKKCVYTNITFSRFLAYGGGYT